MARTRHVTVDGFAAALEDIFDEIDEVPEKALNQGVRKGATETRKLWKQGAAQFRVLNPDRPYKDSIKTRIDRTGDRPQAHIYSTKPGLPHLLEKGHATIGGNRVPGYVHIDPAAQAGFDKTWQATLDAIGKML